MLSKPKVGIIIQARMGSTRLPGKVMEVVSGKTILEHIILRLKRVKKIDAMIIATTENEKDNIISETAKDLGVGVFRGSENNVLKRYFDAASKFNLDIIVRITADCPVIDPEIIDKTIDLFLEHSHIDYVSNTIERTFPRGLDVEVFNFSALKKAYQEAREEHEKEHVTPYIYSNPDKFSIFNYKNKRNYAYYRWTVDTKEDLALISVIYDKLYPKNEEFSFKDILLLFEKYPELIKINQHIIQKPLK